MPSFSHVAQGAFESLFTSDRPVYFNYHGYPIELQGLLYGRPNLGRVVIGGYSEEGTTTSPFDASFIFPFSRIMLSYDVLLDDALQSH